MKQAGFYDVVCHRYVEEPNGGSFSSIKDQGVCMRVGCQNIADCPWSYESLDGRTGFVCWPCDDYWYHMGSRHHKEGCGCDPNYYGQCSSAKMEFRPENLETK